MNSKNTIRLFGALKMLFTAMHGNEVSGMPKILSEFSCIMKFKSYRNFAEIYSGEVYLQLPRKIFL